MKASDRAFAESLNGLTRDELLEVALSEHAARMRLESREASNQRINTEVHIQFMELKENYDVLKKEHDLLKELYRKEPEKNILKTRTTYGRSTEKLLSLIGESSDKPEDFEDESQEEDAGDPEEKKQRIINFPGKKEAPVNGKERAAGRNKGRKRLKESLGSLPQQIVYAIDLAWLSSVIENGECIIANWREHTSIERLPVVYYIRRALTPVVTVALKHFIRTVPFTNLLLPHSYASPSIISDILYRKYALSLPTYRQAQDYEMSGIALGRQTIIHWINHIVPRFMARVSQHMLDCLIRYGFMQTDESYLQVNRDGRGAGHKSFIWVHCSSELLDCPPIIVFCYEATRGTDHLRKLFGEFLGYITCDAYISYRVFEGERDGVIVTGCLMHCRRYFAEALFVNDIADLSEEELAALPETKVLLMIREIYAEENPLRNMSAEERHAQRQLKVKPKVDALFEYVHTLAVSGERFSGRMEKAIQYAVNQEDKLRMFLNNGNIPCDNGNSERRIRAYSIGRANWLFADTVKGAEVNATMYSIVETAKANHADVQIYLQYLLEQIPPKEETNEADDPAFLETMMPWACEYRQYEADTKRKAVESFRNLFPEPEKPRGRIPVRGSAKDQPPDNSDPPAGISAA